MTTASDYSQLSPIQHPLFSVYASPSLETQAETIAARCGRAFVYFSNLFQLTPNFTLLVLSSNDWTTYTPVQPVGMPHFDTDKLVVAGETNEFWQSFTPQKENVSPEYFTAVQNIYGRLDGTIDVSIFFHLLAIHELGHAFHSKIPSYFPRLWIMETFANLCLHTYIASNEPELLPVIETLPQGFVNIDGDLIQHRSLKDFEVLYSNMHPANYVWYQGQFHYLAKQAFDLRGVDALLDFWRVFVLSDAKIHAILRDEIHPSLATTVENWPATDNTTSIAS